MTAHSPLVLLLALVSCGAPPSPSVTPLPRAAYAEWALHTIDGVGALFTRTADALEYGEPMDRVVALRRTLSALADLADQARSISPPNDMRSLHADMIQALDLCRQGFEEYADGNYDASELLLAQCGSTLYDVRLDIE